MIYRLCNLSICNLLWELNDIPDIARSLVIGDRVVINKEGFEGIYKVLALNYVWFDLSKTTKCQLQLEKL